MYDVKEHGTFPCANSEVSFYSKTSFSEDSWCDGGAMKERAEAANPLSISIFQIVVSFKSGCHLTFENPGNPCKQGVSGVFA